MYTIRYTHRIPDSECNWDGSLWSRADTMELKHLRPESSDHRPATQLRLLFNTTGIAGLFRVEDRYVRSLHAHDMEPVYEDSCVEFFVQPKPDAGYFNFEFNCGGAMLGSYITDHRRTSGGFRTYVRFSGQDCASVLRNHTMPPIVDPEITEPATWLLQFFIPFKLLEKYAGTLARRTWKANAFKCGDATSHPHWTSWQPLPEKNFHLPECFGEICFAQ